MASAIILAPLIVVVFCMLVIAAGVVVVVLRAPPPPLIRGLLDLEMVGRWMLTHATSIVRIGVRRLPAIMLVHGNSRRSSFFYPEFFRSHSFVT